MDAIYCLNIMSNKDKNYCHLKRKMTGCTDKEVEQQTGINRRTFRRYRMKYGITNSLRHKND